MKKMSLVIILFSLSFSSQLLAAEKDMIRIKAGCFMMGTNQDAIYEDDDNNYREKPAHKVCLDGFHIDTYEVTQKKWDTVMKMNRSVFHHPEQPITHIYWREARSYCHKVGKRLPTEAEWEYAARAGSKTKFPWGDDIDDDYLWYAGNSPREIPHVGKKKPNAWGLYDMMGNVWEWVEDWFSHEFYKNSQVKNPKGPARQSFRVIRGASWMIDEQYTRVTTRHGGMSDPTLSYWVGVRCAKSL
jgi:formylglycine-generating enzyme